MKNGDIVKIISDNENYVEFIGLKLRITHVARNVKEHQGYDESVSPEKLYDLEVAATGKEVPFSLYDYELKQC